MSAMRGVRNQLKHVLYRSVYKHMLINAVSNIFDETSHWKYDNR